MTKMSLDLGTKTNIDTHGQYSLVDKYDFKVYVVNHHYAIHSNNIFK